MKKILSGIGFLLISVTLSVAQNNIYFRAVTVDTTGNVVLSWHADVNLSSSDTLRVYSATALEGPFSLVGKAGGRDSVFTHVGAEAKAKERQLFYCLHASSAFSDTVSTLFMGMDNHGGGIADLAWRIYTKCNAIPKFVLYRRGLGRDSVARTSSFSYQDTITDCGDTLQYVLELNHCGCHFVSPVCKDYFFDFTAPDTSRLDSVSLHPSYHYAELGWQPSRSVDVMGYITYIYKDGIWRAMDTLYGAENTHYIDSLYADGEVWQYRIAAMDTCRNVSPLGEIHHTVKLTASPNKCDSSVRLSWNDYHHLPGGADAFEVYASAEGGAFVLVGSGSGKAAQFTCRSLDVLKPYSFYVRIWNADRSASSTSSVASVDFHRNISVGSVCVSSVSVCEDSGGIMINTYVPDTVSFNHWILCYRAADESHFIPLDTLPVNQHAYLHSGLDLERSHCYKVQLTDECDQPFAESAEACSIVLRLTAAQQGENRLEWNAYQGFERNPDSYRLYRRSVATEPWNLLDTLSSNTLVYSDMVEEGKIFYYHVAAVGSHRDMPHGDVCYSNTVRSQQDPVTYVPNSFVPSSAIAANRLFKPVNLYVEAKEYTFTIFDRWGQVVFETHSPDEGWDGNINGRPASMGVYVYQLTYRLNEKKMFSKRGMVNLIR